VLVRPTVGRRGARGNRRGVPVGDPWTWSFEAASAGQGAARPAGGARCRRRDRPPRRRRKGVDL